MGLTLTEKILNRASGQSVSPGDVVEINVDLAAFHDLTGYHVVEVMEKMGKVRIWDVNKFVLAFDHLAPPPTERAAEIQVGLRKFAKTASVKFFHDVGDGILHQLLLDQYALPGQVVMAADSHTTTVGAVGAFAQGLGASDVAAIVITGKTWMVAPEPFRIRVLGKPGPGIYGKDVVLHLLGVFKAEGLNGKSAEFFVEDPGAFPMDYRATVSNMGIELGLDAAMFVPDSETVRHIKEKRGVEIKPVTPDPDARYVDGYDVELNKLEPLVAAPHSVDNVKSISEVEGLDVDYVFIGSCTNGRLSDIEVAAKILRNGRVRSRCVAIPASREIYIKASELGYIDTLVRAGCVVTYGTCGPCLGGHFGLVGPGEVAISTGSRNFRGRMGSSEGRVYLANAAVAAATALNGKFTDPRKYLT
ncbi:3-isopropylmalate dehydratase large subunit [Vulcanisaeta souniana]|uniref:3-isopropylmalate dehydratase large subunit n=1 Tax=Vulcanisaeta souniana JCM 11219 TaxID=1293586 RepID=A0A830EJ10_9CREN|nr:3-isopropylmalate dehydratase large subunit [Vulcanisaeta souniana]BDR92516.1 3-isopropylmalate dehydratase large subunit [Vulcanisaeta souniana JCM 11219]GGI76108.1 3-isopropylmalate dehydratase large subunit [Vulcanisaeta souniana JCM 11219]